MNITGAHFVVGWKDDHSEEYLAVFPRSEEFLGFLTVTATENGLEYEPAARMRWKVQF